MLSVTVKTLDSQNHSFNVPDESTVKEFKEQIAPVLNITVDKQRLIFCGKVLKDDKKLSEYDVDGKVIHVVQSLPPQGNSSSSSSSSSTTNGGGSRGSRDAAGFLLGAFSIPQDLVDPAQVQNIVHDVVSGMGGEIGRNATVMSRASDDGTVDVHINLGRMPVSVPMHSEAQLRMNRVQTMLIRANHLMDTLEDGANSTNGNVADSSSQTETSEPENTAMESETSNPGNPLNDSVFENMDSASAPVSAEVNTEINVDVPNEISINRETFRFEGLAQAAQAAISAAFATAAAAARAAATSVGSPVVNNVPLDLRTVSAEPMEESSTETPASDFMDAIPSEEFAVDSEPSSSEPVSVKPEPKPDAATSSQTPFSQPMPSNSASGSTSATTSIPQRSRRPVQPSVQTLANLLDEVIRFNSRLQPSLERVRDLLRTDAPLSGRPCADAQRLFSRISQMLHFLSHAYHSLSDLHVNFTHAPPRSPRVRIISSAQGSILQGLPMQAQISISTSSGPSSTSNTTTTSNNATNESAPSSNSEVRPTPQVTTQTSTSTADTPSIGRGQNPLVFMEVSPTLTIDNIASMVTPQLSNAGSFFNIVPVPEGPFSASSSPRNTSISSAAAQIRALAESRNEANTDSSRSVPRTTSSTAGTSSNGQAPPLNIPFRSLIPVPLTSMGSLHTFDSGLPCHSVWALEPSRRRHNAGGSRTPSAHQQPALTPNFPGRQEDQLQQVISNIVMSLLNHSHNQAPGNAAAGVTVLTSRSGDTPRESSIFTTASSQANRGRASPPDVPSSTQVPPSQGNLPPRPGFATGNSSMRFMLSNIGLANKTIAEVFTGIRDCDLDLLGSFFCFLASKLTFQDVVDIGSGDFESITRIRIPLQNYLRENVFKTENPQPSDYDAVVQAILANEELKMLNFLLQAEVAENECASYVTAFKALIRENIHKVFDALLGRSDIPSGTTYGQHVARTCRELFEKFLQLNSRYSNLDVIALERVLRRQLEPLSQLVDPAYQSVVRVLIFSSLYRLTSGSRNAMSTSSDSSEPAPSSSTDANKKKDEKKAESSERPPQREFTFGNHVNVESSGDIFSNRNLPRGAFTEGSEDGAAPALAAFARIAEQTTALLRGNNRNNDSRPTGVNLVSIRPDSWASSIPQDWVPIIARDVQRQRRQAPQAPFSNAYLSGMPSKRRKIMSNDTPALLEHSQSALSDMLLQAISSADVKPRTSMEEVKADVSKDPSLQSSFNEHMKHAIQERLQRDLDYCSDKFPNSEKYYNI